MADKSGRLIRDALSRAAVEPEGCALLASKSEAGLFPPTGIAKSAAERCKADGYLHVVRTENKGKSAREICVLTEKGRDLAPILLSLAAWGDKHIYGQDAAPTHFRHVACGHRFTPQMTCAACGEPAGVGDLALIETPRAPTVGEALEAAVVEA